MTDEDLIAIAAKYGVGPYSGLALAREIHRSALEQAAKACDELSTDYNKRRRTSDSPTYMEGKSDGAEACASALYRAIHALSQKE